MYIGRQFIANFIHAFVLAVLDLQAIDMIIIINVKNFIKIM